PGLRDPYRHRRVWPGCFARSGRAALQSPPRGFRQVEFPPDLRLKAIAHSAEPQRCDYTRLREAQSCLDFESLALAAPTVSTRPKQQKENIQSASSVIILAKTNLKLK